MHALMAAAGPLLDQPPVSDPQLYRRAVDGLSVERLASPAGGVPTLVHGDLCRKNMLFKDFGVYLIDWSDAVVGPGWLALAGLAPVLVAEGHEPGKADQYLHDASPVWARAHADDVAAMAALISLRHWARAAQESDPLYQQDAQALAQAGWEWLRYRMGAVTSRP